MLFLLIRYDPNIFAWQINADDRISQPSSVVDTVVKYHVFRDFTTPIFLMLKEPHHSDTTLWWGLFGYACLMR
jgi:hypothetical protein